MMRMIGLYISVLVVCTVYGQDPRVTIRESEPVTIMDLNQAKLIAVRDQDVTMSCYVENLPEVTMVRWQKTYWDRSNANFKPQTQTQKISQDTAVEDNTKFSIEKPTDYTWRLRIKAIQVSDEGNYTCFVQTTRESKQSDDRKVIVLVPPYLDPEKTSPDTTVTAGDNIDLMCNATARPTPTIEWTRLGGALLPIGKEKHYSSLLKIRNVKPEDRGRYRCKAYNSVGTVTRDVELNVRFKPIIGDEDNVVYQAVGYRTELQCLAVANPFPNEDELGWVKDAASMSNSVGRFEVRSIRGAFGRLTYELIIHGVEENDYGTYTCKVKNSEGTSYRQIRLERSETPQASVKLGRVITAEESRQIDSSSPLLISISTMLMCLLAALLQH